MYNVGSKRKNKHIESSQTHDKMTANTVDCGQCNENGAYNSVLQQVAIHGNLICFGSINSIRRRQPSAFFDGENPSSSYMEVKLIYPLAFNSYLTAVNPSFRNLCQDNDL